MYHESASKLGRSQSEKTDNHNSEHDKKHEGEYKGLPVFTTSRPTPVSRHHDHSAFKTVSVSGTGFGWEAVGIFCSVIVICCSPGSVEPAAHPETSVPGCHVGCPAFGSSGSANEPVQTCTTVTVGTPYPAGGTVRVTVRVSLVAARRRCV